MGTFLTELTCKINSREEAIKTLINIIEKKGFILNSKQKVSDTMGLNNQFDIFEAKNGWVQIFCPHT